MANGTIVLQCYSNLVLTAEVEKPIVEAGVVMLNSRMVYQ